LVLGFEMIFYMGFKSLKIFCLFQKNLKKSDYILSKNFLYQALMVSFLTTKVD